MKRKFLSTQVVIASFLFLGISPLWAQDIIYVDASATGANDGSSWADAYTELQSALSSAVSGDEIWVAEGTYKPTNDPNRSISFIMKEGVDIYGGFSGSEISREERDLITNLTILSGDIGTPGDSNDNCYHVVIGANNVTLSGFTITGGNTKGDDFSEGGGGMYNNQSSPIVTNCTFSLNSGFLHGGGILNICSSPIVKNCIFSKNSAAFGGGMENQESSPKITDCIFNDNSADFGNGGGIYNQDNSSPTVTNCTFIENSADWGGGGGMHNWDSSSPILINCTFSGNSANAGGGMCNDHSKAKVINCTFSGNAANWWGGGINNDFGSLTVTNCIIWANQPDQIYPSDIATVSYSDIEGGWPGEGNIDTDPLFADVDANDFHLKSQAGRWDANSQSWVIDANTSPCIDAGDWATPIGYEPFPNGGRVNMGAYGGTIEASKSYFGTVPCETIIAGDINSDCKVDFADLAIMAIHWQEEQ